MPSRLAARHGSAPISPASVTNTALLLLAIALPISFNPFGVLAFDSFKHSLVRIIAVVVAVNLALSEPISSWRRVASLIRSGNPPALALLALLLSGLLAVAFSVAPLRSLAGSAHRLDGLLTQMAWLTIGVAIWRSRVASTRLIDCLLLGSLPVILYALIQQARLDPLPWLDRTFGPASTLGTSTALGGYLAMLMPLTLTRLAAGVRSGSVRGTTCLAMLAVLQAAALFATGVRGAILGLIVGLLVWAAPAARSSSPRRWTMLVCAAGLVIILFLNSALPLAEWLQQQHPLLARLGHLAADDPTINERMRLWGAAASLLSQGGLSTLVGFGQESQSLVMERVLPQELAVQLGDLRVDRVHNVALDGLLGSGLLGLVSGGFVLAYLAWAASRRSTGSSGIPSIALVAAICAHLTETSFAFSSPSSTLVLVCAVAILARQSWPVREAGNGERVRSHPVAQAAALILGAALVMLALLSPLADSAYRRALAYHGSGDKLGEAAWLRRATAIAPAEELYRLALGMALTRWAAEERNEALRTSLFIEAERELRFATALSPLDPYGWLHLATLLDIKAAASHDRRIAADAAEAVRRAIELGPPRLSPRLLAIPILLKASQADAALAEANAVIQMDRPTAERVALRGDALLQMGDAAAARSAYRDALERSATASAAHAGLARIEEREGRLAQALQSARLAVKHRQRDWRYRELLARIEQATGNREEAVQHARAAARFAPPWERERLRAIVSELKQGW